MSGVDVVRDVEQDPRIGDVVQYRPRLVDESLPATLTIIEVTDDRVYWVRNGKSWSTSRKYWRGERIHSGPRDRLELIGGAA